MNDPIIQLTDTIASLRTLINRSPLRRGFLLIPLALVCFALLLSTASTALAESATWNLNPVDGDWNTDANWTPMDAPVSGGLAIFDVSNTTNISLSAPISVHGIAFNAGASAFTITMGGNLVNIHDGGITNNSGVTQNFIVEAGRAVSFRGNGTAGNLTAFHITSGDIVFRDTSSAGSATFTIEAGGLIHIFGGSTAGNGVFTNNGLIRLKAHGGNATFTNNGGAVSGAAGGNINIASGGGDNATFINNGGAVSGAGGGRTDFRRLSNTGNSTLIANGGVGGAAGGSIVMRDKAQGGNARVEVFGNGNLDISGLRARGLTTGSIEGSGMVFLGASKLTVGSNNLSTVFSGVMQDGGQNGGSSGSLAILGTGTLTLSGANTYTGGTAINGGKLLVINTIGSGTGSGAVQVNSGTLSGRGTIAGAVTVGTGSGPGATLSPGSRTEVFFDLGTLTIQSPLVFNSDATYDSVLRAKANKVVALGVTINSGATFTFFDFSGGALAPGTVFTVINNTASTPIAGTFSNLADGSTFTVGSNTFKASYHGGTGNDLTLTVQ